MMNHDKVYCYPNSDILINKKCIENKSKLEHAEISYTSVRLLKLQMVPIKGNFDFKHLCRIHAYIFQDLYTWAGQIRTVNIGKGNLFCLVQNIQSYASYIFQNYARDCIAAKDDHAAFVHTLAKHYGDLNALHPFREGNGRAQREFTRELCAHCGYVFDLTGTTHEEMLQASILSFDTGNNTGLEAVFRKAVIPADRR